MLEETRPEPEFSRPLRAIKTLRICRRKKYSDASKSFLSLISREVLYLHTTALLSTKILEENRTKCQLHRREIQPTLPQQF